MEDCIFCKIIEGAVPSKVVYEADSYTHLTLPTTSRV